MYIRKESIMSHLSSCFSPDLFYRIQIRWIWRKVDEYDLFVYVIVLMIGIFFDKPFRFLVPWRIIHYQVVFLTLWRRTAFNKSSYCCDSCFEVEPGRLGYKQLPLRWINKTTIWDFVSSGEWPYFGLTANGSPHTGNGCLGLVMNLILENKDGILVMWNVV